MKKTYLDVDITSVGNQKTSAVSQVIGYGHVQGCFPSGGFDIQLYSSVNKSLNNLWTAPNLKKKLTFIIMILKVKNSLPFDGVMNCSVAKIVLTLQMGSALK